MIFDHEISQRVKAIRAVVMMLCIAVFLAVPMSMAIYHLLRYTGFLK
jgi:membrane protein insertase Oxa1/YidC/SpoIIIJ